MDQFKPVTLAFTPPGIFDARSSADSQTANALAWKQNLQISPDGKLQTANGWVRPWAVNTIIQTNGTPCPYSNADFHDQTPNVTALTREPPTCLYAPTDNEENRYLYLGTKTRFLLLNESSGSWTDLLPSGLGNDGSASLTQTRWHADILQDKIFICNGVDKVQQLTAGQTAQAISVVGLDTAGDDGNGNAAPVKAPNVIIQYQGVILIMNMLENGVRVPSRIRWSDLNDGTCWVTGGGTNPNTLAASISDFQDLTYGQQILGACVLLGFLYVLTDKAIWQCSFTFSNTGAVDGSNNPIYQASLQCNPVYSELKNRSRCLWYPNTLVCDGESMYYAGHDAIYRYNTYMQVPERTEWIFRSTSIIFDDGLGLGGATIDQTSVMSPVAEVWPDRKEIHFSWPVPDATLVNDQSCDLNPPILSSGLNRRTLVISTQWQTCDYRDYGMNCYTSFQPTVAVVGSLGLGPNFFGCPTTDFALKQLGVGYARETFTFNPANTVGSYAAVGYTPLMRLVFPFQNFPNDKQINGLLLDAFTPGTDGGNLFTLRTGTSYTQMNPNFNLGNCGVVWTKWSSKPIKCLMTMTPGQYAAKNLRAAIGHRWKFLARAKFLYAEIAVTDASGNAPVSGGVTFTRMEVPAIDA